MSDLMVLKAGQQVGMCTSKRQDMSKQVIDLVEGVDYKPARRHVRKPNVNRRRLIELVQGMAAGAVILGLVLYLPF